MHSFSWSQYKGPLKWLPAQTIYLTQYGSRAYRTHTPESDYDVRGTVIPPKEYYLGFKQSFEQVDAKEPDLTIFGLQKFFHLAAECNPNIIEVLFTDDEDHIQVTPLGEMLLAHRDEFLSKEVKHTFHGYATSQFRRLKLHYNWHKHPRKVPPTRKEFDLPEMSVINKEQLDAANAAIRKQMDQWSVQFLNGANNALRIEVLNKMQEHLAEINISMQADLWIGAARVLGFETNFIEVLAKERKFQAAKQEWSQYLAWQRDRNPKRAALEAEFGMDLKHAYHLVRLIRMCKEILSTGKVLVKRPDREELLAIRNGAWTYEQLIAWFEEQTLIIDELYKTSTLPKEPNRDRLNALCIEMTEKSLSGKLGPHVRKIRLASVRWSAVLHPCPSGREGREDRSLFRDRQAEDLLLEREAHVYRRGVISYGQSQSVHREAESGRDCEVSSARQLHGPQDPFRRALHIGSHWRDTP